MSISGRSAKLGIAVGLVLLLAVVGGVASVFPTASNQGYAPVQPIPYSHRLHAGELKIPCLYCHSGAEKSRHANIPALNVCMNCHRVVKTDSPYIKQITAAYVAGKPIEWVRVHEVADYVYFPHKRHVAAGVSCQTCHGPVQEMDRVYQYSALTMGWCMECHRGQTTPKNVLQKFYPSQSGGPDAPHGPVAPVNCSTCHK
jgi:hypothetical protein